jgi:hypothetical protein
MPAAQVEVRTMTQTALKYDVEVDEDGRVELRVPFPSGAHVTIFVIRESESDALYDLVSAAESSLDFWDNPLDDEDWNEA